MKGVVENASLTCHANVIAEDMHVAAAESYGMSKKPRKPWVSQETLELMELREKARKGNHSTWEKHSHQKIRTEIKKGRKQ